MNIGEEIPTLSAGLVPLSAFNKVARTINRLRKISLGPGLTGKATACGVCLDAAPVATPRRGMPYGTEWLFGLTFDGVKVIVHNCAFFRNGLFVTDWDGEGTWDPEGQNATTSDGDWTVAGSIAKVFIGYKYDTKERTGEVVAAAGLADIVTLPVDNTEALEIMRYYKIPLYEIHANHIPPDDPESEEGARYQNHRVKRDFIHGMFAPGLMA